MPSDIAFRKRLVAYCIQLQEQTYAEVQKAMREAQAEANAYGPPKDRYDGFRNQQLRKGLMFEKQSEQALGNIKALNLIDEHMKDKADFGSLIITDKLVYFVAIGLGMIDFEGIRIAAISPHVPVFQAMKGKKEGESFTINGTVHKINKII